MDVTQVPLKQFKGKKKNIKMNNKMQKKKRTPQGENGNVSDVEVVETKPVLTPLEPMLPPTFSLSEIKNKQRRHQMFMKLKQDKRKQKMQVKKTRKKEREALGDKAPPKEVPKTIENQRVYDETTVDPDDEEVAFDEGTDEFSSYFNKLTNPKVLITTSDRPRGRTVRFCEQLATVIPDAHVYYRRGLALKRVIPQCVSRGFTYLMVINEDRKMPNGLVLCHLPDGPTAHFKVSSVRLRKEMKRRGKEPTEHTPEVILNNFSTRLGHGIGRMFAALFPHDPQFVGRQVATFHNQRDFVFFRFHRYIFKNEKRAGIQELGPRFTLKLRSLQKGTFDSKFGEYEWVLKGSDSDDSDSDDSETAGQRTREVLARRPSYRKILNDLSGEEVGKETSTTVTGIMPSSTPIYQTSSGQYITIAANGTIQLANPGSDGLQGLQALTMTTAASAQQGTTILQYAQTSDGQQILVPSNQVVVQGAGGEMQTYQIHTPAQSSLGQTVVMSSPVSMSSHTKSDDPTMKREIRLAKNREAARECRRKKKEYVKCLENRVAVLENQNKTLIEELKTLKDLYCVKTG